MVTRMIKRFFPLLLVLSACQKNVENQSLEGEVSLGTPRVITDVVQPHTPPGPSMEEVLQGFSCPQDGSYVLIQPFEEKLDQRLLALDQRPTSGIGGRKGQTAGRINDFLVYSEGDKKYLVLTQGSQLQIREYIWNADQAAVDSQSLQDKTDLGEIAHTLLYVEQDGVKGIVAGTLTSLYFVPLNAAGKFGTDRKRVIVPGGAAVLAFAEGSVSMAPVTKNLFSKLSLSLPPPAAANDLSVSGGLLYFGSASGGYLRAMPLANFATGGCVVDTVGAAYRDYDFRKLAVLNQQLVVFAEKIPTQLDFTIPGVLGAIISNMEALRNDFVGTLEGILDPSYSRVDAVNLTDRTIHLQTMGANYFRPHMTDFAIQGDKILLAADRFLDSQAAQDQLGGAFDKLLVNECREHTGNVCAAAYGALSDVLLKTLSVQAVPADYRPIADYLLTSWIVKDVASDNRLVVNNSNLGNIQVNVGPSGDVWVAGSGLFKGVMDTNGGHGSLVGWTDAQIELRKVRKALYVDSPNQYSHLRLMGSAFQPEVLQHHQGLRPDASPIVYKSAGMPRFLLAYGSGRPSVLTLGDYALSLDKAFLFTGGSDPGVPSYGPSGDSLSGFNLSTDRIAADPVTGNLALAGFDSAAQRLQLGVRDSRGQMHSIVDGPAASEIPVLNGGPCLKVKKEKRWLDVRIVNDVVYVLFKEKSTPLPEVACAAGGYMNKASLGFLVYNDLSGVGGYVNQFKDFPYADFASFAARFVELPRDNGTDSHGLIETRDMFYGFRRFSNGNVGMAELFQKDVPFHFLSESPDRKWLVGAQPFNTKEFVRWSAEAIFKQIADPGRRADPPMQINWNNVPAAHLLIDTPFRGTLARIQAVDENRVLVEELTGGGNDLVQLAMPQLAGGGHAYLRLMQKQAGRYVQVGEEYFPAFYDYLLNYKDPLKLLVGTADEGLLYYQLPPN